MDALKYVASQSHANTCSASQLQRSTTAPPAKPDYNFASLATTVADRDVSRAFLAANAPSGTTHGTSSAVGGALSALSQYDDDDDDDDES